MLKDPLEVGVTRDASVVERFIKLIVGRIVAVPYGQWQRAVTHD